LFHIFAKLIENAKFLDLIGSIYSIPNELYFMLNDSLLLLLLIFVNNIIIVYYYFFIFIFWRIWCCESGI